MSVKTQEQERARAAKLMEEDLLLKWQSWGWSVPAMLKTGKGVALFSYDTEEKIRRFFKRVIK